MKKVAKNQVYTLKKWFRFTLSVLACALFLFSLYGVYISAVGRFGLGLGIAVSCGVTAVILAEILQIDEKKRERLGE
jgi:MFS family permease